MTGDSKSGDIILKLVNLLPVPVNAGININSDSEILPEALKTVLTGNPDDKEAVPVTSGTTVSNNFKYEMPGYSFTIIRIKTK